VLALFIASKNKSFEKVFKNTLISLIGIISVLSMFTYFHVQGYLPVKGLSESLQNFLPLQVVPLVEKWHASLLYVTLNVSSLSLFSLLIWGFINRFMTLSEGIKWYIPLAFVIGLVGALITTFGLQLSGASDWSFFSLINAALNLMFGALILFYWAYKRLPENFSLSEKPLIESRSRFPFLTAAYLLAGFVMVAHILTLLFKYHAKTQFSDPITYSHFMSNYSKLLGFSTILISLLWLVTGTRLILKKGFKTTILCGVISVLIGGLVYFSLSIADQSVDWFNQGMFTGLLKETTAALFFPLIQMLYLNLPSQARLRTKIVTEMIALPIMTSIPSLLTQGLLIVFGSMSAISLYLNILTLILVGLVVVASRRISSRFTHEFVKS